MFASREGGGTHVKENAYVYAISLAFESNRGQSNYEDFGMESRLLNSIHSPEQGK